MGPEPGALRTGEEDKKEVKMRKGCKKKGEEGKRKVRMNRNK